jgi:hypothetical protein
VAVEEGKASHRVTPLWVGLEIPIPVIPMVTVLLYFQEQLGELSEFYCFIL